MVAAKKEVTEPRVPIG